MEILFLFGERIRKKRLKMRIYLNENKVETEDEKHFIDVKVLNFGFKA